ncbi:MAG: M15 family metallopeptidase [Alphaproteobacteria bacterium]
MKKIQPSDLTLMNDDYYRVELAYARDDNLLFGERIYRRDARLWLHQDLAHTVRNATRICLDDYGYRFILYDGLRTIEAQEAMMRTRRVKDNPHWLVAPRLLSPAGSGGHPRAMAIDIGLETMDGELLDMGCAFDYLAENPHKDANPAHREYAHSPDILSNRKILDDCMSRAADDWGLPLFPLPQEWWDFRMPPETFNQYTPISEDDLPDEMRLLDH